MKHKTKDIIMNGTSCRLFARHSSFGLPLGPIDATRFVRYALSIGG